MKRLFRFLMILALLLVAGRALYPRLDRAYEDKTGLHLDETAQMLTESGRETAQKLLETLDALDLGTLSADVQPLLENAASLSDAQLRAELSRITERHGVHLTGEQLDKAVKLSRSLQGLSPDALRERYEQLRQTLQTIRDAKERAEDVLEQLSALTDAGKDLLDMVFSLLPKENR